MQTCYYLQIMILLMIYGLPARAQELGTTADNIGDRDVGDRRSSETLASVEDSRYQMDMSACIASLEANTSEVIANTTMRDDVQDAQSTITESRLVNVLTFNEVSETFMLQQIELPRKLPQLAIANVADIAPVEPTLPPVVPPRPRPRSTVFPPAEVQNAIRVLRED